MRNKFAIFFAGAATAFALIWMIGLIINMTIEGFPFIHPVGPLLVVAFLLSIACFGLAALVKPKEEHKRCEICGKILPPLSEETDCSSCRNPTS